MNNFNWDTSFLVDFDLQTGLSKTAEVTKRYLSQMKTMFHNTEAVEKILENDDPVIYEFYELGFPEKAGHIAFGTTIIHPGTIGGEYYMTKGHFHTILETAEVYYTLDGEGFMVMENPEGDTLEVPLRKGEAIYVPKRYAHRSVNTGTIPSRHVLQLWR
ncbi:MAG: glucose-6-phosphate isomerase family protein [Muricomes sp.]